mmetsp:Transcript_7232/g.20239  ORF Transcript_7232/g.20239 Transcript_7232/m.20239 type:complete len:446 (-) Transcript_7232:838-2175(-)
MGASRTRPGARRKNASPPPAHSAPPVLAQGRRRLPLPDLHEPDAAPPAAAPPVPVHRRAHPRAVPREHAERVGPDILQHDDVPLREGGGQGQVVRQVVALEAEGAGDVDGGSVGGRAARRRARLELLAAGPVCLHPPGVLLGVGLPRAAVGPEVDHGGPRASLLRLQELDPRGQEPDLGEDRLAELGDDLLKVTGEQVRDLRSEVLGIGLEGRNYVGGVSALRLLPVPSRPLVRAVVGRQAAADINVPYDLVGGIAVALRAGRPLPVHLPRELDRDLDARGEHLHAHAPAADVHVHAGHPAGVRRVPVDAEQLLPVLLVEGNAKLPRRGGDGQGLDAAGADQRVDPEPDRAEGEAFRMLEHDLLNDLFRPVELGVVVEVHMDSAPDGVLELAARLRRGVEDHPRGVDVHVVRGVEQLPDGGGLQPQVVAVAGMPQQPREGARLHR